LEPVYTPKYSSYPSDRETHTDKSLEELVGGFVVDISLEGSAVSVCNVDMLFAGFLESMHPAKFSGFVKIFNQAVVQDCSVHTRFPQEKNKCRFCCVVWYILDSGLSTLKNLGCSRCVAFPRNGYIMCRTEYRSPIHH
jgi:hypothetical protein